MTRTRTLLGCTILAVCLAAPGGFALAQQSGGGLLVSFFHPGNDQAQPAPQPAPQPMQQLGPQAGGGVNSRIDRIESALRQLTGQIEVLQHQNQTLQMQLKRMQDDTEYRFQQMGRGQAAAPARPLCPASATRPCRRCRSECGAAPPPPGNQVASAGQGDAFNPAMNPNAPGAPRSLGGMPGQPAMIKV